MSPNEPLVADTPVLGDPRSLSKQGLLNFEMACSLIDSTQGRRSGANSHRPPVSATQRKRNFDLSTSGPPTSFAQLDAQSSASKSRVPACTSPGHWLSLHYRSESVFRAYPNLARSSGLFSSIRALTSLHPSRCIAALLSFQTMSTVCDFLDHRVSTTKALHQVHHRCW